VNDQISDKWESDMVAQWKTQYNDQQAAGTGFFTGADDKELPDPDGQLSNPTYEEQKTAGDHVSVFSEYRGFILDGGGFDAGGQNGHTGGHKRLSPARKEALLEVDHTPNLQYSPPGGVKTYFDSATRIWSREAGVHVYYVTDNSNLPAPPFVDGMTTTEFDQVAMTYLSAHRGTPGGPTSVDAALRRYFTHIIVLSSIPGPRSGALGFTYTEMDTSLKERRGIYINTAQIQIQANLWNAANPPAISTTEVGGVTIAHEVMHMVIAPNDATQWDSGEHRIGVPPEFEPTLMKSGAGFTKNHLREASVKIDMVTQLWIDLASNPALQ
jgi:hypothetical protein